jgi:hypothetical protein
MVKPFLISLTFAAGMLFLAGTAEAQTRGQGQQNGRDDAAMKGNASGPRDGSGIQRRGGATRNGQGNGPRRGNKTGPQDKSGPGCN